MPHPWSCTSSPAPLPRQEGDAISLCLSITVATRRGGNTHLNRIPRCSDQGLANLLWAYSKVTVPLLDVMMMIVGEMAGRLHSPEGIVHFDAQVRPCSVFISSFCS